MKRAGRGGQPQPSPNVTKKKNTLPISLETTSTRTPGVPEQKHTSELWQDWPVKVKISHFLVSNVPSKFYRLLLLVFFLLNSNSNHQQFQSSDFDVVVAVWCHDGRSHARVGMSRRKISQLFRSQINRNNIFLQIKYIQRIVLKFKSMKKGLSCRTSKRKKGGLETGGEGGPTPTKPKCYQKEKYVANQS